MKYLMQHSQMAALKLSETLERQLSALSHHPHLGRPGRIPKTRELLISGTPYIVVYRLGASNGRLEILQFLHGATITASHHGRVKR